MQVTLQRHTNHTLVRLRGDLDALSCARVLEEVEGEAGSRPLLFVLNMQGVRFIDSTGMDAILRVSDTLNARGGRLVVSSPSTFCRIVMERSGLDRVVPILPSDEAARSR